MIGKRNVRVTVLNYTETQNPTTGKPVSSLTGSWEKWAEVKQQNGSRTLENAGIVFKKVYQIEMAFEQSRPTLDKYFLQYKGHTLSIGSVIVKEEGNAFTEIITAFTTN